MNQQEEDLFEARCDVVMAGAAVLRAKKMVEEATKRWDAANKLVAAIERQVKEAPCAQD